ncbi:FecR family protein [Ancylomarina subtilis]|uniref:FecR family protein n=1 Tax=Ancylomarina subtilis TaxID=1639035 RepID=A0A4Q7V710_9BACT|nr:FecR family protein [Ancylomarina subtilis]RZT91357.1 FecR family protein [Ancylomarina subtilis]
MNRIDHHIRISQLIAKEINFGLDESERQELDTWINNNEENQVAYEKICKQEEFLNWDEDFHQVNVGEGWERFEKALSPNKTRQAFQAIFRYAAVICIPLFFAGIGYYLYNDLINLSQQQQDKFVRNEPQALKAQLTLADGRNVNLDDYKVSALKEKDGTQIEKGEGSLKYQAGNDKRALLYNTVRIPKGSEYELVLADGTKVHLNAMSSLKFPIQFIGKTRNVKLTGEAYFEVSKDAKHPFIVDVLGTKVEVLGTSFNVKAYKEDENVVTTLVEGSVKVRSSGFKAKTMMLEPGQQAVVNEASGDIMKQEVNVDLYTSWRQGVFLFKDQRIEDIMTELSRWYDLKVFYKNSSVKDYRFGGHFNRNSEIGSIMEMFELTRKVDVEINGQTIVIGEK